VGLLNTNGGLVLDEQACGEKLVGGIWFAGGICLFLGRRGMASSVGLEEVLEGVRRLCKIHKIKIIPIIRLRVRISIPVGASRRLV
jgi:hypothetical protein